MHPKSNLHSLPSLNQQVAATPVDPAAEPRPSSDVSDARWFPIDALPSLESEGAARTTLKTGCMVPSCLATSCSWLTCNARAHLCARLAELTIGCASIAKEAAIRFDPA
jgi:hypothetical protein